MSYVNPLKVVFRVFKEGDVIALLCGSGIDANPGNVVSYMHVGQHGEASRYLGRDLRLATPEEYEPLRKELARIYECEVVPVKRLQVLQSISKPKWAGRLPVRDDVLFVNYHRPPTRAEIKFGHGATHHREFAVHTVCFPGTRIAKCWFVADDGLRYYR